MAYMALSVAKYFVNKAIAEDRPISNLKLQKIMYFIQRDYLKNHDGVPFFDDPIEAWQFGPVVPPVYYKYCAFGSMPITADYSLDESIESHSQNFINSVYDKLKNKNAWDLVDETHKDGGPWKETYKDGSGNHKVIPLELIVEKG